MKINVMWILILLLYSYLPMTGDALAGHRETLTANDLLFLENFAFTFTGRHLSPTYSLHSQTPLTPRPGFPTTIEPQTRYSFSTHSNLLSYTHSSSNPTILYSTLTGYANVSVPLPVCKIYPATHPPDDRLAQKDSLIAPVPLPGNYLKIEITCTKHQEPLNYFAWNRAGGAVAPV